MEIVFTKQALKDAEKIKQNKALKKKVYKLLNILQEGPFKNPPPFERLVGNLQGLYSRRINIKHRLVYTATENEVKIISMWTHYEF